MTESNLGAPPKYSAVDSYSSRSTNYSELASGDLNDTPLDLPTNL